MALKWPDKDPQECLDYPLGFQDWLEDGRALQNPVVSAIIPNNGESPVALFLPPEAPAPLLASSGNSSPEVLDTVVVWLEGGTNNTTYTLVIEADDDLASPKDRHVVRRVNIKVKEK